MSTVLHVGMADLVAARHPATLISLGLGSCIGVAIYDEVAKVAGMAHIMLPESRGENTPKPGKFADTAVCALVNELLQMGASKSRLKAKMAGGAQMFALGGKGSSILSVGDRNVEATKRALSGLDIPLVAFDVGGNKGRSVEFRTDRWVLIVRVIGSAVKEL